MNANFLKCIEFLQDVEYIKNKKQLKSFVETIYKQFNTKPFSLEFDIVPHEKDNCYIFIHGNRMGYIELFGKCNLDKAYKYDYILGYDMQTEMGTIGQFLNCQL